MFNGSPLRQFSFALLLTTLWSAASVRDAHAQGFISPSFGYNFGGDAGCLTATDCEEKNWNFSLSFGALGSVVGFEAEWMYEDEFLGQTQNPASKVMTFMGNFMLAPKISVVQPYGLVGMGLIRTTAEDTILNLEEGENQIGWNIGGGMIVYLHRNVGLKGDVRYYHSFEALDLFGLELAADENRLDFGRFAFGVVFAF